MIIPRNPQQLLDLSNFVYIASAFFAVLATVCVFVFGNRVASLKDNELRTYQKEADVRIAEADAKAAEAHSAASIANQRAEEANAIAEQSRLDKAKLEHDNLLLQEQLDRERDARLAIEKRIAQRGLTNAEIGLLRRSTYSLGVQPIDIVFYKDDAESRLLASNLAVAFYTWKVTLFEAPGGISHQVDVEYDPNDGNATERAKAIFDALRATNKLNMGGPWESLPHDIQGTSPNFYPTPPTATIRIVVGYR